MFYPCFTGILSGANRADVLKDPPKHIKRGTFGAIIFSFLMYSSLFLLWGSVADSRYLKGEVLQVASGNHSEHAGGVDHFVAGRAVVEQIVWNPFPKAVEGGPQMHPGCTPVLRRVTRTQRHMHVPAGRWMLPEVDE